MTDGMVIVTRDKWLLTPGGDLSDGDRKLLEQAGPGARFLTPADALAEAEKDGSPDVETLRAMAPPPPGFLALTPERKAGLGRQANEAYKGLQDEIAMWMTVVRARRIRDLRTKRRCSWRRVAEVVHREWGTDAAWLPPDNQIAGMVLCEVAADLMDEDGQADPWN